MIIYAAISRVRDAAILVEVSAPDVKGNAGQVTQMLMEHLSKNQEENPYIQEGERRTFKQRNEAEDDFFSHFIEACSAAMSDEELVEEYFFHVYLKDGVYYTCIGDDPDLSDQKVSFAFLEQVETEFRRMFRQGRIATANAYAMEKNFGSNMPASMHYHNIHQTELRQEAKIRAILVKVDDIKKVMTLHMNLLLENTDRLSTLVTKSEVMREEAVVFKKKATRVRRKQGRKHFYIVFGIFMAVLIVLYLGAGAICGFTFARCRRKWNDLSDKLNYEDADAGEEGN